MLAIRRDQGAVTLSGGCYRRQIAQNDMLNLNHAYIVQ